MFDERLFEPYAAAYFTGRFYFDVHPPLGKLLIAGAAKLLGVHAATLGQADPAVVLRVLPALAGAALVPLMWLMLRQLGAGRAAAALGATLVLLDNALLVQSRFILLDTMLMAFGVGAITLYLAARVRAGPTRFALLAACGVCAGASASVKWTGLAALGLVLLALLTAVASGRRRPSLVVAEAATVIATAAAVYVASFAIHFALLRNSGSGDAWMPPAFQATLRGNPRYDPAARQSLLESLVVLNRAMARAHHSIPAAHLAFASKWYTWPLMLRPLHYWTGDALPAGRAANIHLFGNPVVWYGALIGMIVAIVVAARAESPLSGHRAATAFLTAGFAINYVPFAFVSRELFIYSYLPALLFAIALASYGAGEMFRWNSAPARVNARAAFWLIVAAVAVGFVIVAPISYGWSVPAGSIYSFSVYP